MSDYELASKIAELMEENQRMRECLEWWLRTAENSGWSSSALSIKLALGMEVTEEEMEMA